MPEAMSRNAALVPAELEIVMSVQGRQLAKPDILAGFCGECGGCFESCEQCIIDHG
jgi:hypothetical protein